MRNPFLPDEAEMAPVTITKLTPELSNKIQAQLDAGATLLIVRNEISPELVKEVAEVTEAMLKITGITDQATAAVANSALKRAKKLVKDLENDRKKMDGPLNDAKAANKAAEDGIIASLQKLAIVVNNNITAFQVAEENKARKIAEDLQRQRDEELAAANAERARVNKIKDLILAFERNCLMAINTATFADIDAKITTLSGVKLSPEIYAEYYIEAMDMYYVCVDRFNARKFELTQLEAAKATNKAEADRIASEQAEASNNRLREIKASAMAADNERIERELSDTANIQMSHELKTSLNTGAKGVQKRWTFDEETIDIAKLPAEYLTFDKAKITAAIAAGLHEIPGVNIYQKIINVSR